MSNKQSVVPEERTCAELSCSDLADCVTDRAGQAQCVCRRGYQGDGQTCAIIPSHCESQIIIEILTSHCLSLSLSLVKIRGYANPETAQLRSAEETDISTIEDIGPSVVHYYEISNTGPFDVGNVFVRETSYFSSNVRPLLSCPFFSWKSVGRCRAPRATGCSTSPRPPTSSTLEGGPDWRRRRRSSASLILSSSTPGTSGRPGGPDSWTERTMALSTALESSSTTGGWPGYQS